jgi:glucose/arabinose dehydrogenase
MRMSLRVVRLLGFLFILLLALFTLSLPVDVDAQPPQPNLPSGFVSTMVVNGLNAPTSMRFAPDGRLFILEQGGSVRIVQNDAIVATFLTSSDLGGGISYAGERGLLGIAFPPNFASNPYVYLYYTATSPILHNRVSRFPVNGNDAGAEEIIFELDQLGNTNVVHNGGTMEFGQDGKLYIAVGDNQQHEKSQSFTSVFGKILRINSDGSIPTDNPFYGQTTGNNRAIWAMGLRNPFNFDMQPVSPYRLFINDVGESAWEEINQAVAGANYGWRITEGPFDAGQYPDLTNPIYAYSHSNGCAIVGAAFYNPATQMFPASYTGDYFFMDYCDHWMRVYDVATDTAATFATNLDYAPVAIEVASNGTLYYLVQSDAPTNGKLYKITYATTGQPQITDNPDPLTVAEDEPATFSCAAAGDTPLTFKWQRNNIDIPGTTSVSSTSPATRSYTIPATVFATDNGAQFRCVVTNSAGAATSQNATLTVQENQRPAGAISIIIPGGGERYNAGDTITYSGTGSDPEDGVLGGTNMEWSIRLFHDEVNNLHSHPILNSLPGVTSGTFTPAATGHAYYNVWYRVFLTVTDSDGLSQQVYHDIYPNTVAFSVYTQPSGLKISLDELPVQNTPINTRSIINMERMLEAPLTQVFNGKIYTFVSWSDGGAADHTITTPNTDVSYTAVYQEISAGVNHEITRTPTLTWVHIPWALGYEIQIEDDPDFDTSDPIYYSKSDIPADAISFTVPAANALPDGTYYWRLRALRSDGTWGTWSTVSTFTVELS